jgi:hypothetical protein
MTPTLLGRIQTRTFLLVAIGSLWTLAITPLLPATGPLGARYQATFTVLAIVLLVGFAWDCLYYLLQQFRWEKDWPTGFGLLNGINEGVAVWLIVTAGVVPGVSAVSATAFVLHFAILWIIIWSFVNGPMRVPFLRWRFRGGRLI